MSHSSEPLAPAPNDALERRVRLTYLYAPEDQAIAAELLAARKLVRALAAEFAGENFANLEEDGPNSSQYLEEYLEHWGPAAQPTAEKDA